MPFSEPSGFGGGILPMRSKSKKISLYSFSSRKIP
jgi:hypothetical protein